MSAALMLLASCSDNMYDDLAEDGYSVCVKFDPNGGRFDVGADIAFYDVYSANQDSIKLFQPWEGRAQEFANYTVRNKGYNFAYWYYLDENGNEVEWNFEDSLAIDKNQTYSRENPIITLYAKWLPYKVFEFYVEDSEGNWVQITQNGTPYVYNGESIRLPRIETARDMMNKADNLGNWFYTEKYFKPLDSSFDQYNDCISGRTFVGAYTDESCSPESLITPKTETTDFTAAEYFQRHPELDPMNDPVKIYTKWEEGNWFNIYSENDFEYTVRQLKAGNSKFANAKIRLMADLDFSKTGRAWFMDDMSTNADLYIDGNGHTISGINATANANAKSGGIFGSLSENAVIKNLTIANSTFTVPAYSGEGTARYGLLAGSIANGAVLENIKFENCSINISDDVVIDKVNIYAISPYDGAQPAWLAPFPDFKTAEPEDIGITVNVDGKSWSFSDGGYVVFTEQQQ